MVLTVAEEPEVGPRGDRGGARLSVGLARFPRVETDALLTAGGRICGAHARPTPSI